MVEIPWESHIDPKWWLKSHDNPLENPLKLAHRPHPGRRTQADGHRADGGQRQQQRQAVHGADHAPGVGTHARIKDEG